MSESTGPSPREGRARADQARLDGRQARRAPRASRSPDAVVVGGGIVGCAAAAFLAEAGQSVLLVEQSGLASAASGANSGFVQNPFDPPLTGLYEETLRLYEELSQLQAGFTLPPGPVGLLFLGRDRGAAERLCARLQTAFPAEGAEVLDGPALRALEPALNPALVACRARTGHPVAPAASTYAYATVAERRGVTIRLGRVARLEIRGDRVAGVRLDGERVVPTASVLVAGGPWTPSIVDPSGGWSPIGRRWGAVVELELPNAPRHGLEEAGIESELAGVVAHDHGIPPNAPSAGVAGPEGRNVAPMTPVADAFSLFTAGGATVVGSTFLLDEPDPAAWVIPLLERGRTFVPGIAEAPIRGIRACARPVSMDGRPLIGALPGVDRLFVCAGHGPWGISTGPASARLAVDLLLGGPAQVPAELAAGRFGSPFLRPPGSPRPASPPSGSA